MRRLFLFAAISAVLTATPAHSEPTRATTCELSLKARTFTGHRIVVSGLINAGLDRMTLSDPACPKRPIALSIDNRVAKQPDVWPLWKAIYREGSIGTVGKRITGTVTGRFHSTVGWPNAELVVEHVRDLRVERLVR